MVTVLMAAYNGRAYLKGQLDSILAQTRQDLQVIVSDDCSRDGTDGLIDEYETIYPDKVLALHRKKASGGASAHFLELLKLMADLADKERENSEVLKAYSLSDSRIWKLREAAAAKYFMLSDQDDVWLPKKVEVLAGKMAEMSHEYDGPEAPGPEVPAHESPSPRHFARQNNHSQNSGTPTKKRPCPLLIHSDLQVVDHDLHLIAPSFFKYQKISPERTGLSQLLVQNNVTGGAVMINCEMLPYLRTLPEVCLMHDAWLALLACCFGAVGYVEKPLYSYRQHISNTLGAEKGDNLKSAGKRLSDGSSARENYRKMFGQAASLMSLFPEELSAEQKEILSAFVSLPGKSRTGKIRLIIKYGFTKNTWLRTLGQMLLIGD